MADSHVHIIAVVKAIMDTRPNRLCIERQSLLALLSIQDSSRIL